MEVSKPVLSLAMTLMLIGGLAIGASMNTVLWHTDPKVRVNMYTFFETARGSWSDGSGNLITDIGERYVRNAIGFANATGAGTVNATKWISLSNVGSPLVTWTELDTEVAANGFARALATVASWKNGTDYAYNASYKFTSTGSQQLQTAGLQWSGLSATDGNLFAAATFTQTTFEANDNLTITWVITWDAN